LHASDASAANDLQDAQAFKARRTHGGDRLITGARSSGCEPCLGSEYERLRELPDHEALDECDGTIALSWIVVVEARENEPITVGASDPPGGHHLVAIRYDPPRDRELVEHRVPE